MATTYLPGKLPSEYCLAYKVFKDVAVSWTFVKLTDRFILWTTVFEWDSAEKNLPLRPIFREGVVSLINKWDWQDKSFVQSQMLNMESATTYLPGKLPSEYCLAYKVFKDVAVSWTFVKLTDRFILWTTVFEWDSAEKNLPLRPIFREGVVSLINKWDWQDKSFVQSQMLNMESATTYLPGRLPSEYCRR